MKKIKLLSTILLFLYALTNLAQSGKLEIGVEEKLDTYLPKDLMFTNEQNELVNLNDLIDKPTILNLVYYRCPGICSPIMEGVASVVDKLDMEIGDDYQILTVSFNPIETIDVGIKKKKNYLNIVKTRDASAGWQYFVGDSANINRLTKSVGFYYKKTGNDFLHPGTIIVISPDKKITRYLNGTYFLPLEVKLALLEASEEISGPTINRVLQFCYNYDPAGQKYVLNVTKISATVILFMAGILLIILFIRPYFKKKRV